MIHFSLVCESEHSFDGWFRNGEDFDSQSARKLVTCPVCNSTAVAKALMAPSVATSRKQEKLALSAGEKQREMMAQLRGLVEKMRENSDYVGEKFAEEARKIHFGETEMRSIHGEATAEEAKSLLEDGVEFMPLPVLPESHN